MAKQQVMVSRPVETSYGRVVSVDQEHVTIAIRASKFAAQKYMNGFVAAVPEATREIVTVSTSRWLEVREALRQEFSLVYAREDADLSERELAGGSMKIEIE